MLWVSLRCCERSIDKFDNFFLQNLLASLLEVIEETFQYGLPIWTFAQSMPRNILEILMRREKSIENANLQLCTGEKFIAVN